MARDAVVEVLTARFGLVPAAISERIYAIDDVVRLRALLRLAGTAPSLVDFEQNL